MTTLLVLTVGQSDVQLVLDDVRYELEPSSCGLLHDEIERRGYRLVDVPARKDRKRWGELPAGELTLCTPKLDAALSMLQGPPPASALILETRRTVRGDPRLAGAVLERRLREHELQVTRRYAILKDEEWLEDLSDARDAVVRRDVVRGIAHVIAETLAEFSPNMVVAVTTGGLPAANAVIEEILRMHAVGRASVQVLEVPDGALQGQGDRAVREKFHPAHGFRARWQALSLIEGGNFLGAWGAVSHLLNAPGQEWTHIIDRLRRFAASLPPERGNFDHYVLDQTPMAARVALRVELALRMGDVPRAVHGTVAFFEAALWDGLSDRVERSEDSNRSRYFKIKHGPAPSGSKLLRVGDKSDEDRKRPFELKDSQGGIDWYWIHDHERFAASRLAEHFLNHKCLFLFDGVLGREIRALRNDVAHGEPTDKLMEGARDQMRHAKLWSIDDRFLTQKLVKDVLAELGVLDPESLLNDLLTDVRQRLLTP